MDTDQIMRYLQDWNLWARDLDTGIKREHFLSKILKSIKSKEIIVLSGVRRCGKSTLLLQVIESIMSSSEAKNALIINLEDPRVLNITVEDLMQIYETYLSVLNPDKEHYVVLDEVQNVPQWESFSRYLYENKKVNVFITGSNSRLLSSEYGSALSGRYLEYRITPLLFSEFLGFRGLRGLGKLEMAKSELKIKRLFREYVAYGGFPKVVLTKDISEKRRILTSYYNTILIKDIALRYKIKETRKLQELSRFYLTNVSKIISLNKIKSMLGLSLETVQRFSEYLESSYLIHFMPKFDFFYSKQVANPKKIFAGDLGMRNNAAFQFSEDYGRLLENLVFLALKRNYREVYYYKTANKLEVDFAVKEKNRIKLLIQVTKGFEDFGVRERELKALVKGMKETKHKRGIILTEDTEERIDIDGFQVFVKPIWKWLLAGARV